MYNVIGDIMNLNLSSTNFLIINILAAVIGIYFILKSKKNKDKSISSKSIRLNFYEKSYFYKGANYIHNTIIAMLLYLNECNAINIEKTFYKNRKGEDAINYIFTKGNLENIDNVLAKLIDIIFSFSDNDKISSRELNKIRRDAPDDYNNKFYELIDLLEKQFVKLGLKKEHSSSDKVLTNFLGFFILLGLGMISIYNSAYIGVINIVLSIMFFGLSISNVAELPQAGKNKFEELSKLETRLKKLELDTGDPTLVAIGFGLKYENILAIRNKSNNGYDIYFDSDRSDFQSTMRTALVGDSFLVK
jgi:hypothetical protein